MKKFFAWIGGITVVLATVYMLFKYKDWFKLKAAEEVQPPSLLASEAEAQAYELAVQQKAQELAKMKAEEALKKWKERFRSNRTSP